MNDFRNRFLSFNSTIGDAYERLNIRCISDIKIDGMGYLEFISNLLNDIKPIHHYDWFGLQTDIEFISMELKYNTALLFLLRPYINFPTRERKTYIQTLQDKRYLSCASVLYQVLYNYWDRIGDYLYAFLKTNLNERDVYINRVMNKMREFYPASEYCQNLGNIYDEHLSVFLKSRRTIVHYIGIGSRMYTDTFKNLDDDDKLAKLETEKNNYPEYFRDQIEKTFIGFENAIRLINENGTRK